MQRQSGVSLLEIILVLAIVGLIMVLVICYFSIDNNNLKITRAVAQIKKITKASYQWLAAQRQVNYGAGATAISMTKLKMAGLLAAADYHDPWGGTITLAPTQGDPSYVTITLHQVPSKACKNLHQQMRGIAHRQTRIVDCATKKKTYFVEM